MAAAVVIAELREIEEIRINGIDPAGNTAVGGDTIQVIGDFSTTSLRLNTITIDGDAGDDTVDISALTSAHRIVFRSNGGHDTIIGTLRPEDVIELPEGSDPAEYTSSTVNGVTTLTNGQHSISYTAAGEGPQIGGMEVQQSKSADFLAMMAAEKLDKSVSGGNVSTNRVRAAAAVMRQIAAPTRRERSRGMALAF